MKEETICWHCARAAGKDACQWAQRLEPMPGWDAVPTLIYHTTPSETYLLRSYRVIGCPGYQSDPPRNKSVAGH